jgi:error-prone DNA polymerase
MAKEHPGMYGRAVLADRLQSAIERVLEVAGSVGGGRLGGKALSGGKGGARAAGGGHGAERSAAQAPPHEHAFLRAADLATGAPTGFAIPSPRRLAQWLDLATALQGFPRHLSQHVGGFVLTQGPLTRIVPVENAAMPERSIVQWDKDDLDAVGLLKVDVLALGMLSAIHRCLDLIGQRRGKPLRLQDIPAEDPATYDMMCRADTVGVFQIESRAQMSMLPRLKPRCFYDLVVQVAIVRPGPIQGGMVHPYLQARANPAAVQYASPALEEVLKRTLGVPIFQEQVMQIAMAAANFSGGEADSLRRSMAAWKRKGGVHHFYDRLVGAMVANGYTQEFADGLFKQIEGFGEYGFPESHAASFALLVYVSCWLKQHEPACFLAAMLNSQPLGFYGPSQLVQDARRHGVPVRSIDVNHSDWDCTLEKDAEKLGSAQTATEKMGSDPDSGQQPVRSAQPITKSGSDPICGHAQSPSRGQAQTPSPQDRNGSQRNRGQSPISYDVTSSEQATVLNRDPTPITPPPIACFADEGAGSPPLRGEPTEREQTAEPMGSDPDSGQQAIRSAQPITKSGSDPIGGHAQNPSPQAPDHLPIRLGLRMVNGLRHEVAQRIAQERASAPFASTHDLAHRCGLDAGDLKALASADALRSVSGHRRQQVWDASALHAAPALFRGVPVEEDALALPAAFEGEEVVFDYAATGLSLRSHPVAFLRAQLSAQKLLSAAQMRDFPHGRLARACGIVTMRQQPHTAKGVIFVTLEDETGSVNVIVWKAVKEAFRPALYRARLLAVYGVWQRDESSGGQVRHLIAKRLVDLTHLLGDLSAESRDFH